MSAKLKRTCEPSRESRGSGELPVLKCATVLASAGYADMPLVEPPPALRPMKDFDPSEPAILHDRVTDTIISWSGEEVDAFRRTAVDRQDGTIAWHRFVFDGWGNVLGG